MENTGVRELSSSYIQPSENSQNFKHILSMERRCHQNSYHGKWNNQVLPVVIYLTLPTVSCQPTSEIATGKHTKSQRQKQRDQKRLHDFIERKSVCSLFPFSSVNNQEIQNMIPRQPSFIPKIIEQQAVSQSNKIAELQEENKQLTVMIDHLRDSVTNEKRKSSDIENENSVLNMEISKVQGRLQDAENVILILQCNYNLEQNKLRGAETEILKLKQEIIQGKNQQKDIWNLKEEMCCKFDREIENNERIRKEHSKEVKELKVEIRNLKAQVSNCDSKQVNTKQITFSGAAHNGTSSTKYTEHFNENASRGQIHQRLSTNKTKQNIQCHRCESLYSAHQPNECPVRNFMCGYCSKRGHHTLNCLQVCRGCGANGRLYHRLEDCTAQESNCAYCSVRGHLTHMCLKKRYDTEGF